MDNTALPLQILTASAGSGKTHALVERILSICLKKEKGHTEIRHILALTFTNKAANEMKERILMWLQEFTHQDYQQSTKLNELRKKLSVQGVEVDLLTLHSRSVLLLQYILHNYSAINISTIDKFNAKIVKSFSQELGLAHQFNLEIDAAPFVLEAVDSLINEVGVNPQLSFVLLDYLRYNQDEQKHTSLPKLLFDKSKEFINDVNYQGLKDNEAFNWTAYDATRTQLRDKIKSLNLTIETTKAELTDLINERNFSAEDFDGRTYSIFNWVKKLESNKFDTNKTIQRFLSGEPLAHKKATAVVKQKLEEIEDRVRHLAHTLIEAHTNKEELKFILKEILPLVIFKEIERKIKQIEDENDIVLLSKFNTLIYENLKDEPSQFIYEKIGTKFHHFFVDEFQDTSLMQWLNLVPLKHNAISSSGHSFTLIGDPKQSIYGFRGGDSQLMIDLIAEAEKNQKTSYVNKLKNNYRSAKNVVLFNNDLYKRISALLLDVSHREMFSDAVQEHVSQEEGRVRLFYSNTKGIAAKDEFLSQMQKDIQQCLHDGYTLSDITILLRSNSDIRYFAQALGKMLIIENGTETYISTLSDQGLTLDLSSTILALIEYLQWELQPQKTENLINFLYYLNQTGKLDFKDFTQETLHILNLTDKHSILKYLREHHDIELPLYIKPSIALYSTIESLLHKLSVPGVETIYILNFLETVYNFSQARSANFQDLISYWQEEAHKVSIKASESINAIRLMTIHAAKGLEFPVVFIPYMGPTKKTPFDWYPIEEFPGLKSVRVNKLPFPLSSPHQQAFQEKLATRKDLEELCVLYVATTRAVSQLHLYIEKESKTEGSENLKKNLRQWYPPTGDLYEVAGTLELDQRAKGRKETDVQKIQLTTNKYSKVSNVRIATPSKSYQARNESVRIGLLMHEILEKTTGPENIASTLKRYALEGIITTIEKETIEKRILSLFENHPELLSLHLKFPNRVEQEVLLQTPDTKTVLRMDRVVETPEGIIIIDYKTGSPKPHHERQMTAYKESLENIGLKVLSTKLIYL